MFCPECGTNNEYDAKFCVNCGLNFSKIQIPDQPAHQSGYYDQSNTSYEAPISPPQGEYRTHSPIIDHLEDAEISDYRDQVSSMYYILSFFIFPVGIYLWAFHRDRKPESAKNILAASIAGFFMMFLLLL